MADEFHGGVCGGSWWGSSRNVFGSSLCSSDAVNDIGGGFGWPGELFGMKKTRSSDESASASDGSVVLQDVHNRPVNPEDSTLQMMNTTSDWSQALFQNNNNNNGRSSSESNYSCMLQSDMNTGMNYVQESGMDCPQTIQKEWSPKNYTSSVSEDSSTTNTFEPVINTHQSFALNNQQQQFSSITRSAADYTSTCQALSTSFSMNSPSSSSYGYPSNLLQTLFDDDANTHQPPQKSLFHNQSVNLPSTTNYFTSLEGFSSPKLSPMLKASLPKQQLPFSGNTCSWNASAAPLNHMRASLLSSTQLQMPSSTATSEKINFRNLTAKPNNEELVAKKTNDEPAFKRPRIETPSPLPTFKVRKEKLGDRITALQQLVSPFGKTDTASVLHEAIEYIKFLHDQVNVFSTPYLKNGSPGQRQQTGADKIAGQEAPKQDLRSRGLCLVPLSSTFPVAAETTTDFWTPSFGGAFR